MPDDRTDRSHPPAVTEPPSPVRQALLLRAARTGRVRSAAIELLDALWAATGQPGQVLAGGLRGARHLHSAERRLVGDGVRAIVRERAVLRALLGSSTSEALWLGWLVSRGLEPSQASALAERPAAFDSVVDLRAATETLCRDLDPVEALALRGSFARPIAAALHRSLGDRAVDFLCASADRAPLDLRVNLLRCDVAQAMASLAAQGIATERTPLSPDGLRVVGRANLHGSRAYRDGWVEVQDEGSQLLAAIVQPEGGLVVDLCAGAGGKSLALAAAAPSARIVAADVRGWALGELERRARRAGATVQTLRLRGDGALPDSASSLVGRADRVLVDAPCSGTGTLRRHPEHRLRLDGEALAELPRLQSSILDRAADLVRPGGRLIYGTCSVLHAENRDVVDDFLQRKPAFRRLALRDIVGNELADRIGDGVGLQLAPHDQGTDGFFGAVLTR